MDKKIAKKWVAALRSGDYKQAKGQLRTSDNSFCCLGVLCNLHAEDHPKIAREQTDPIRYISQKDILPDAVCSWSGMESKAGYAYNIKIGTREYTTLAEANDAGATFEQIANWIEKHYEDL